MLYLTPLAQWTPSRNLAWQTLQPDTAARLLGDGVLGDPDQFALEPVTYARPAGRPWEPWRAEH